MNSINVTEGVAVIYKRERSKIWQVRVKLADKCWHRFSTGERNQREAMKVAVKLYYDKEFRRENKLPQSSRKFGAVADAVVRELQESIDSGTGKSVYTSYITAINKYLKPFFKSYNLDWHSPKSLDSFHSAV